MIDYTWTSLRECLKCLMTPIQRLVQSLLKMGILFQWVGMGSLKAFLIIVRILQLGLHYPLLYTLKLMLYASLLVLVQMERVLPCTLRFHLALSVLSLSCSLVSLMLSWDSYMRKTWWDIRY